MRLRALSGLLVIGAMLGGGLWLRAADPSPEAAGGAPLQEQVRVLAELVRRQEARLRELETRAAQQVEDRKKEAEIAEENQLRAQEEMRLLVERLDKIERAQQEAPTKFEFDEFKRDFERMERDLRRLAP